MAMFDEVHGAPGKKGSFDGWFRQRTKWPDPFFMSARYAGLGRNDAAFASLEQAFEQRCAMELMILLNIDPQFDRLHSDPRFDAFLQKTGLPPRPKHNP